MSIDAQRDVSIGGDVVGRDKITVGYTVEQVQTLLTQISSAFQPNRLMDAAPTSAWTTSPKMTPIASLGAKRW